jgi:hypothetical protein
VLLNQPFVLAEVCRRPSDIPTVDPDSSDGHRGSRTSLIEELDKHSFFLWKLSSTRSDLTSSSDSARLATGTNFAISSSPVGDLARDVDPGGCDVVSMTAKNDREQQHVKPFLHFIALQYLNRSMTSRKIT